MLITNHAIPGMFLFAAITRETASHLRGAE
jgi:hypothetical protein